MVAESKRDFPITIIMFRNSALFSYNEIMDVPGMMKSIICFECSHGMQDVAPLFRPCKYFNSMCSNYSK